MYKNKKARADILQAVIRHDGKANTTQIRTETGLSRSRMNYWYRTLAEENLIEIEHDEQGRRVAVITDEAREAVRKGEYGKEVLDEDQQKRDEITLSRSKFENLIDRVESVENQNQALIERVQELEKNQEHLLERVAVLRMYVETFRKNGDSSEIQETMEKVEEKILKKEDLDASLRKYSEKKL